MKPQPKSKQKKLAKRLTVNQQRKRREKMKIRARKLSEMHGLVTDAEKVIKEQNKMLKKQEAEIQEQKAKEESKLTSRIVKWFKK
jgi:hypothetical protein|tara:strand:+ start:3831 stop:4085 length:255 start_codon:yes stop_codon:yes gene_type:complete